MHAYRCPCCGWTWVEHNANDCPTCGYDHIRDLTREATEDDWPEEGWEADQVPL
jgi:predicted RNA-binding Zn-ribbon protein involved in translation (DUF1610 family)